MKGSESVVSICRLKPTYIEDLTDTPSAPQETSFPSHSTSSPPKVTLTGRQVYWPKRL